MSWDAASRSLAAMLVVALSLSAYVVCGLATYALVPLAEKGAITAPGGLSLALCVPFALLCTLAMVPVSRSLLDQRRSAREIARLVAGCGRAPSPSLAAAAARTGLAGRVTMIDDREAFSFVHGVLAPRVLISRGLLRELSASELHAVLEHERYHVAQLDPLRTALCRVLCAGFFFLPALGALGARYMTARELAADERAVATHGRGALAGALLKAARAQAPGSVRGPAALVEPATLDARVLRLETGAQPRLRKPTMGELGLSLIGAGVFLGAFLLTLYGLASAPVARPVISLLSVSGLLEAILWLAPPACALLGAYWWLARRALASPPADGQTLTQREGGLSGA